MRSFNVLTSVWVYGLLIIVTLVVMYALQIVGKPLVTEASPMGILSFEFAGNMAAARSIVDSWGASGRVYGALSLGLDYLFLVLYPAAIGWGCWKVAKRFADRKLNIVAKAGRILAWSQIGAGLLDAVENYALIKVLLGSSTEFWPQLAAYCATPKFAIVISGLLFLIGGLIISAIIRRRS